MIFGIVIVVILYLVFGGLAGTGIGNALGGGGRPGGGLRPRL